MRNLVIIIGMLILSSLVATAAEPGIRKKPANFQISKYVYTVYKVNDMDKMQLRELYKVNQKDFLAFCDFESDELIVVEGFEMPIFNGVQIIDTLDTYIGYMIEFPEGTRAEAWKVAWESKDKDSYYYDNLPREGVLGDNLAAIKGDKLFYKAGVTKRDLVAMDKKYSAAKQAFEKK